MHKQAFDGEQIFAIHDFLSPEECDHYIRFTENIGYHPAPIMTSFGPRMASEVRNNERVMIDDVKWANLLWARAEPFIPSPFKFRTASGLNERFRFYRYDVGQTFRPHQDAAFGRNDEVSQLTFMVYLNDGCQGGETNIYMQDDGLTLENDAIVRVAPERGKALVFAHLLLHEGARVLGGRKYVMRTDVMYRLR